MFIVAGRPGVAEYSGPRRSVGKQPPVARPDPELSTNQITRPATLNVTVAGELHRTGGIKAVCPQAAAAGLGL